MFVSDWIQNHRYVAIRSRVATANAVVAGERLQRDAHRGHQVPRWIAAKYIISLLPEKERRVTKQHPRADGARAMRSSKLAAAKFRCPTIRSSARKPSTGWRGPPCASETCRP